MKVTSLVVTLVSDWCRPVIRRYLYASLLLCGFAVLVVVGPYTVDASGQQIAVHNLQVYDSVRNSDMEEKTLFLQKLVLLREQKDVASQILSSSPHTEHRSHWNFHLDLSPYHHSVLFTLTLPGRSGPGMHGEQPTEKIERTLYPLLDNYTVACLRLLKQMTAEAGMGGTLLFDDENIRGTDTEASSLPEKKRGVNPVMQQLWDGWRIEAESALYNQRVQIDVILQGQGGERAHRDELVAMLESYLVACRHLLDQIMVGGGKQTSLARLDRPGSPPRTPVDALEPESLSEEQAEMPTQPILTPLHITLPVIATTHFSPVGAAAVSDSTMTDAYSRLFREAKEISPEVRAAVALKEQKYAQRYTALANRYSPTVDFELSQERTFNKIDEETLDSQTTGQSASGSSTDVDETEEEPYSDGESLTEWKFDLDMPLYNRSSSLQLEIAELEYEKAVDNLLIKSQELDTTLRELLGNYMVACYRLLNIENSIEISQQHVARIQRGYELRDQTKLALLRAQANLKELESRKDLGNQLKDTALRSLLDFSGLEADAPVLRQLNALLADEQSASGLIVDFANVEENFQQLSDFFTGDEELLRDYFVAHSLYYKKIVLEKDLAQTAANKHTQNEWPDLFVRGAFERKEDSPLEDFEGQGSIAVVLSVPLFSGGTLLSTAYTQSVAKRLASLQEHADIRSTFNSLVNSKNSIVSLRELRKKQQAHLAQQQEIVRLSLKSYKIKQTSMQELLTSKNTLIDTKNSLIQTTMTMGALLHKFAWQIGRPFATPELKPPPL